MFWVILDRNHIRCTLILNASELKSRIIGMIKCIIELVNVLRYPDYDL